MFKLLLHLLLISHNPPLNTFTYYIYMKKIKKIKNFFPDESRVFLLSPFTYIIDEKLVGCRLLILRSLLCLADKHLPLSERWRSAPQRSSKQAAHHLLPESNKPYITLSNMCMDCMMFSSWTGGRERNKSEAVD